MAACGVDGCNTQKSSDFCYAGYTVNPGSAGATLFTAANPASTAVAGTYFNPTVMGRQSNQNYPGCQPNGGGLRAARTGSDGNPWVWVYAVGGPSGWTPINGITFDSSKAVCGPAGQDFDCNAAPPTRCAGQTICDGVSQSGASRNQSSKVTANYAYFRAAPSSTPIDYVVSGDIMTIKCAVVISGVEYWCGTVTTGKYIPTGSVGWVVTSAFQ